MAKRKFALKESRTYRVSGDNYRWLIAYDYASGRRNRYTLIQLTGDEIEEPIIRGREIPMKLCRDLIEKFEAKRTALLEAFENADARDPVFPVVIPNKCCGLH